MPVAHCDPDAVRRTLRSIRLQRGGWSLTVVTAEDQADELRKLVHACTSLRDRRRVRVLQAKGPCSARELLGIGMEAGQGLPRALLFQGDVWAPDAVTLLSAALTPTNVVYADEDEQRADGTWEAPQLKPDFSPEFLLSSAYIGRPLAIGALVADHLPPPRGIGCTRARARVRVGRHRSGRRRGPHPRGAVPSLDPGRRARRCDIVPAHRGGAAAPGGRRDRRVRRRRPAAVAWCGRTGPTSRSASSSPSVTSHDSSAPAWNPLQRLRAATPSNWCSSTTAPPTPRPSRWWSGWPSAPTSTCWSIPGRSTGRL